MNDEQRKQLEEMRQLHQKRLHILEKQAATFGLSAPPHVTIEIEDIQREIASIDARLAAHEGPAPTVAEMQQGITILFLSADPRDTARLRLGQELREIQDRLQLAKYRDRLRLKQRMSVRPVDISQALLDVQPQIVHFSGHGTHADALCFEDVLGETHPIEPDALAALFEQFASQVSCVVLNACYSRTQADAIAKHIDFVVGMAQAISDEAAIAFSVGFYQALGAGRTIEDAYQFGCVQIRLENIPEHLTPVLVRKGTTTVTES